MSLSDAHLYLLIDTGSYLLKFQLILILLLFWSMRMKISVHTTMRDVSSLQFPTLKLEAAVTYETSVTLYKKALRHISEASVFFFKVFAFKTSNITFKVCVWQINPLKAKVTLNYTSIFSCYHAVNPLFLDYKILSLNTAWGNNRWLLIRTKQRCTLWELLSVNPEGKLM
jgi:hypothetical protein